MFSLPILESIFDKPIVAGYSISSIFEYWWLGLIVVIVLAVLLLATYFLLAWLFGRMRFKDDDKEQFANYKRAPRKEKKAIAKSANRPVKNVITWRKMSGWLIPVVCVVALLGFASASFLPSAAFKNLLFTLGGSHVHIIDTEASRQAAKEAEKNVVTIQEEGTVLLKNTNDSLPLKAKDDEENLALVPMVCSMVMVVLVHSKPMAELQKPMALILISQERLKN